MILVAERENRKIKEKRREGKQKKREGGEERARDEEDELLMQPYRRSTKRVR